jgi:VanZ family protein
MRTIGRRTRTVIWLFFLGAAFVTTHVPPGDLPIPPGTNDKLMHFIGFTVLAFLTVWRLSDMPRPVAFRALLLSLVGLAAYGIFDEATQPYFGRTFDLLDWAADIGGAVTGIAIAVAWHGRLLKAGERHRLG